MIKEKPYKTYKDCYMYKKYPQYSIELSNAIMKFDRMDKEEKAFDDVVYEIKRARTDATIVKVLTSPNTVLLNCAKPLPKMFKVFCAKDFKDDGKIKVFIDVSNIIKRDATGYITNVDTLLSYLINAKVCMYYALKPNIIFSSSERKMLAATCFSALYTHIIDYIGKISIIEYAKDKCIYLSARYFLTNIANIDNEDQIRSMARRISGITEMKENTYDFMASKEITKDNNPFLCPVAFSKMIANQFKLDKITFELILDKWLFQYGENTAFALEFFPAFSAMMTDAYSGAYINNQKTIEKICGKDMVAYAKGIIYDFG